MLFPTRPPRQFSDRHIKEGWARDYERVLQEDGRIAVFKFNYVSGAGWEIDHYTDRHGFVIHDPEAPADYARILTDNEVPFERVICLQLKNPINVETVVGENEQLHAYRYGGLLSMRAGWYVTPKESPKRVLRSKMVAMS